LKIAAAKVTQKEGDTAGDYLDVTIDSVPEVERVAVRWRMTHPAGHPRQEAVLVGADGPNGSKRWSLPPGGIPVAKGATVVFDAVYYVGGKKFTDDNQGCWYLADQTPRH
jgi:hypothetical protein